MSQAPTRRPTARFTATLLAAILSFAWLAVSAPPASASTAVVHASARETSFASMINADRRRHGLKPLRVVADLTLVARTWSGRMAGAGDISHNPRLTKQVGAWRTVGENVGVGPGTRLLHNAFMASPEHRANVLSSAYTEIGIGVVRRHGTLYVTEDFRRPARTRGTAAAASVAPAVAPTAAVPAPAPVAAPDPVPAVVADDALAAELARLAALPAPAAEDPVGSAFGFLSTMRGLTS